MENKLTHEDSLKIITGIIATAKGNVSQGAFHMILWGWVAMIVSFSHFMLMKYQVINHPEMVWLLMIPTFVVSMVVGFRKGKKENLRTHLDSLYMWVWLALSLTMGLMIFYIAPRWEIISPMVLILAGYATFISGTIIKFRPMIYGGISFWLWSLIAYYAGPYYGLLITSAGILTGYLIPGMMLQRKNNDIKTP
jgi:hypothetical protein